MCVFRRWRASEREKFIKRIWVLIVVHQHSLVVSARFSAALSISKMLMHICVPSILDSVWFDMRPISVKLLCLEASGIACICECMEAQACASAGGRIQISWASVLGLPMEGSASPLRRRELVHIVTFRLRQFTIRLVNSSLSPQTRWICTTIFTIRAVYSFVRRLPEISPQLLCTAWTKWPPARCHGNDLTSSSAGFSVSSNTHLFYKYNPKMYN